MSDEYLTECYFYVVHYGVPRFVTGFQQGQLTGVFSALFSSAGHDLESRNINPNAIGQFLDLLLHLSDRFRCKQQTQTAQLKFLWLCDLELFSCPVRHLSFGPLTNWSKVYLTQNAFCSLRLSLRWPPATLIYTIIFFQVDKLGDQNNLKYSHWKIPIVPNATVKKR